MQGEEGIVTYFDLDVIKNKTVRDSYINAKAITMESKKQIILNLNQIIKALEDMRY
jgi:hypothetical protein